MVKYGECNENVLIHCPFCHLRASFACFLASLSLASSIASSMSSSEPSDCQSSVNNCGCSFRPPSPPNKRRHISAKLYRSWLNGKRKHHWVPVQSVNGPKIDHNSNCVICNRNVTLFTFHCCSRCCLNYAHVKCVPTSLHEVGNGWVCPPCEHFNESSASNY